MDDATGRSLDGTNLEKLTKAAFLVTAFTVVSPLYKHFSSVSLHTELRFALWVAHDYQVCLHVFYFSQMDASILYARN